MSSDLTFKTSMAFSYGEPAEMAPGIVRLVANNPSPFTFKGTNTYLVGTSALAIIDPGPEDAAHCAAILEAIAGRPVSHILITHTHRDHIDGLPRVREATGAKVAAYGRQTPLAGRAGSSGSEFFEADFSPDIVLRDGDEITGPGWRLKAVFTPGHAPDHLCFAADDGILFSGDHVMAWNTSVVAPPEGNMGDYLASLERLLERSDAVYFPGHGGRVENPGRTVRAYLLHRRWREQAIVEAIRTGHTQIDEIVRLIYQGLDPRLVNAASLSVQAHVEHLMGRGLLVCAGPLTWQSPLSIA